MTTLTAAQAIERLDQAAHRAQAEETAAQAIGTGKTRLILSKDAKSVFFASLVMRLKFAPDWQHETAATDGRQIVYNPDFINGLNEPEIIGLLAHEVMHCTNKHFARRCERDPEEWNIACDLAINPLLFESGFTLPDGALLPGFAPYADFPDGLSAEEYFNLLQQQKQPQPDGQQADTGSPGPGEPGDGRTAGDDDSPGETPGTGTPDPGRCGGIMDPAKDDGSPAEPGEAQQLDQEWTVNVAAAQQAAERRGSLPGGLARLCGNILAPAADWNSALREFITRPAKANYNWKRPNRRHIHRGIYLPSLNSLEIGHIVAVIDTSGSIGLDTLTRFASELDDIARQGASRITIVYHDSIVCKVEEWTPEDGPLTLAPCGGGGTDHCPVFAWIDEQDEPPAVVVCLTDLASRFPDAPEYPVLWASTDSRASHPFGERIDIPSV